MIWLDNVCSAEFKLFVEKFPERPVPKRKFEKFSIPGRSGDVVIAEDAWDNVVQPYDVYLSAEGADLAASAAAVVQWLFAPGVRRLEDDYAPEVFREARFLGPTTLENILNDFGRATLQFDCAPQRFLKSGEMPIPMTNQMTLANPTIYPAQPLLTFSADEGDTLTIGAQTMFVLQNGRYIVDVRRGRIWATDGTTLYDADARISGTLPELRAGESLLWWTGNVRAGEIVPRWWTL